MLSVTNTEFTLIKKECEMSPTCHNFYAVSEELEDCICVQQQQSILLETCAKMM